MENFKLRKSNRMNRKIKRNKPPISGSERRVIELLRKGKCHKEIGNELNIATTTVSKHIMNASRKMKVTKETALVNDYLHMKHSLIDFE